MKTFKKTFIYSLIWDFIKDFNPAVRGIVVLITVGLFAAAFSLFIGIALNWGHIHY